MKRSNLLPMRASDDEMTLLRRRAGKDRMALAAWLRVQLKLPPVVMGRPALNKLKNK